MITGKVSAIVHLRGLNSALGMLAAMFACGIWLSASATTITVEGTRIIKDGEIFVPRGYIVESFVAPKEQLEAITNTVAPEYTNIVTRMLLGQDFYLDTGKFGPGGPYATNKTALQVIKDWGANTVRFNLNQWPLATNSPNYSPQYLSTVTNIIKRARDTNLVVIIAMFTSNNKNMPPEIQAANTNRPLATPETLAAFLKLEEYFGNDQGVIFEWYNENWPPCGMTEAWKLWRDGGKVSYSNDWYNIQFTGVNEMLTKMRAAGSQNPIIVQGLWTFEGFPTNVIDPSNKLIYAMHPFLNVELDLLDWDTIFGDFARSNAFLVTAWSATTSTNEGWCQSCGFETAGDFLEYIDVRDIGLLAYAVDVPWSMATHFTNSVIDVRGFSTTNCTEWGNAGELMTNYIISSQIDTNPPAMPWIPPSISTNAPNYYVWFNLSSNSFAAGDTGFWSTNNGSTWSPYTNGTSFMVYSSVTLRVYARDLAGNKSATNTATYIIDTVAPDIWYWLPSLTTNKAFYHYFDVSENYGEWSTNNGVTWSQFTTNGWGRTFSNATTLIMRGHDVAGNFSATNAATYTFDTNAPVVGNWKASFTTNTSHYIWINISENYGYWSTNSGANWNRYTNGTGAGFWFTNTATLWAYGLDVAGNYSATNKATYTIIR